MKRNFKQCPKCNKNISLSNYNKHLKSKSCGITTKYPWNEYYIDSNKYKCPDGFIGTKKQCATHLSYANNKNLKNNLYEHNLKIRLKLKNVWNKSKTTPNNVKLKISKKLKNYYKNHKMILSEETKLKISKSRIKLLKEKPELHPNRKLANNRIKMSYPERVAFDWLTKNKIKFEHQKRINKFYPDFTINKLIIEIDGERWHSSDSQIKKDQERDLILKNMGYSIIRISAKDKIEKRLEEIFTGCSSVW